MRVLIDSGKSAPSNGKGYVDYTKYVLDGSLTVEDSINVPTLTTFQLSAIDNVFVVPSRSTYVKVVSDVYSTAPGYLSASGAPAVLATGFVTNQPEPDFLGLNQGLPAQKFQQLTFNVNVTSDEWLLNCQSIPYIPAFVGQTDSQILAAIADALMPGFFNTSLMASGNLIPYYQYDPSQTWSDIAKTFADQNRYYYKVINKQIVYQPFGKTGTNVGGLGIAYDETTQVERQLFPLQMKTSVVNVPPVNDCIVLGDTEPQANWDNYFVGDGFTSNFQFKHQVFQGNSSNLLQDDWTEGGFQTGTWIVNDPQNTISLSDSNGNPLGALNVVQKGTSQTYTPIQNATFIQAQNGLELGGGLNLQHGQIIFNDTASGGGGVIGGIFEETFEFDPGHCLAGFKIQGQPNLGAFTIFQVSTTGATMAVALSISGTNTTLSPGNVGTCAGLTATFLNGQELFITSIVQLADANGNPYFILTCTPQNPGILPASYGPANDNGTITFGADATIVTASGAAGIYMYPLYNGAVTGTPVVSQPNHQYVLQTWIGAEAPNRFTRPYTNLTQTTTYGAQNLAASGTITWVITDVNLGNYVIQQQFPLFGLFPAAPPPAVTKFFIPHVTLPPFATYVLLSGLDLNVAINYTLLSLPPQGYLTVQSLTGTSGGKLPVLPSQLTIATPYQLGFGMINQSAQISLSGEAFSLSFYTDDIPSVGARIRCQSWAAGQSVARVRDTAAIANEAKVSGDSGIRSAIMQNLSPLPRTSDECEAAAGAAILDREYPQWQGSYTIETEPWGFETLFNPSMYGYPHTGLFFYVNSPARGVSGQNFFVNTVRIQVVEIRQEVLTISLDYGPDLYLEKLLPAFLESEQNLLVPTQTVSPPSPITLPQVLNAHLPTLNSAQVISIVNAVSGNYIVVDLSGGVEPNAGASNGILHSIGATGCEVRYVDSGWGTTGAGRVGIFTVDQFTLPRTVRDQTFYLRGLNNNVFSRFSKALRIVYPLVPSAPTLVSSNATTIVADFAGDVRDIYGIELRALAASGVSGDIIVQIPQDPNTNPTISLNWFNRFNVDIAPFNPPFASGPALGPGTTSYYSSVPIGAPGYNNPDVPFTVGDIVLVTCPSDSSFAGFRVLAPPASGFNTAGFFDRIFYSYEFGQPMPDQKGGEAASPLGTMQLVSRNGYALTASGSLSSATSTSTPIAKIVTRSPHGLSPGQLFCIGARACAQAQVSLTPSFPPHFGFGIIPPSRFDDSIFCGTFTVGAVIDAQTFEFFYPPNGIIVAGENIATMPLNGLVAGFPPNIVAGFGFNFFIPGAPPGAILQRPVFAPSDLTIDLTAPDIQKALAILESATPGSRIGGLALLFFNLTWDYSAPTIIPSFIIPAISGLFVDLPSQNLKWSIIQGLPDGHRVETFDATAAVVYTRFTTDHPSNPQLLTQAPIPSPDWLNPRLFKVTPFDALGDGIPSFVAWGGSSGIAPIAATGIIVGPQGNAFPAMLGNWEGTSLEFQPLGIGNINTGTINQLQIWMFKLESAFTFNRLTIRSSNTSGVHAGFGVYDFNGNKLIGWDNLTMNFNNFTYTINPTGGAVTLPPGYYYWACAVDSTATVSIAGEITNSGSGESGKPWNNSLVRNGVAANLMVSGVLPATLGALTAGYPIGANGQPAWVVEPIT